jgi:hypothetical protein
LAATGRLRRIEQGACVHPMLGKPMRAAIGGGKAVISSHVKVAAAGASLDVPLGHKVDSWSFPHFDTITVSVADVVAQARRDRGFRPTFHVGQSSDRVPSRAGPVRRTDGRGDEGPKVIALITEHYLDPAVGTEVATLFAADSYMGG